MPSPQKDPNKDDNFGWSTNSAAAIGELPLGSSGLIANNITQHGPSDFESHGILAQGLPTFTSNTSA